MFLFFQLQVKLPNYLTREQVQRVAEAFLFAADAHETQFRSSGEPYIIHPVAVAASLADMHMDVETIMAALLHDVVEDTPITCEDIARLFGDKVAQLVEGVTKLTQMHFETKAEAQAENFRKMMLAMVEDIRVILIKLADRLHNMKTLGALRPDKRRRIARETMEVFVPIANRLGMNSFKAEFENLGFAAMYPLRALILKQCVKAARGNRRKLLEKIHDVIVKRLSQEDVPAENVVGREKRLYSIYKKMRNRSVPFSEIMDVYGFRVIAKDVVDCYRLLGIVHSIYKPVPGRFKDYIAIPKANGYQSLHTTLFGPHGVPIEIQIRTAEMNNMAENGIAAHWVYKAEGYVTATEVKTREWLNNLLDMQERTGSSIEFVENVKIDLFPDEVYVFTPQGEIMQLQRGVTALDFAYAVHTDIGNHCIAVKVNRRRVPLDYCLANGQTVEVITDEQATPDPAWLRFVVTGKAKGAIRHYLKTQQQAESVRLGRKLLAYSLSEYRFQWTDVAEEHRQGLLAALGLKTEKQLFEQIGVGDRSSAMVAHQMMKKLDQGDIEPTQESVFVVTGEPGQNMHFCHACCPIPGDDIFGMLRKERGIEVHQKGCLVVTGPEDSRIALQWADELLSLFAVRLHVDVENNRGVLATVMTQVSQDKANVVEVSLKASSSSFGLVDMVIEVRSRLHLARIIRHLRKCRRVLRVTRISSVRGRNKESI